MEELFRDRIHEALEVESTPPSLRARVMDSLPAASHRVGRRPLRLTGQWAAGVVATLLALSIIVGLLYSRGLMPFVPVKHTPVPPIGLISPEDVAAAPDGSVYISDFLGDRVFMLRPDGKVLLYAGGGSGGDGPAKKAALFHPAGIALDRGGNLYIADVPGGTIREVDTHGNLSTIWESRIAPFGLAVDKSAAIWVSSIYGPVGPARGVGITIDGSSLPPPRWIPGYIAFGPDGDLYITDRATGPQNSDLYNSPPAGGGCRIVRMNPDDGNLTIIAGTGVCGFSGDGGAAKSAQLDDPGGIAFDTAGNLYFADTNNHRIRRIDKNGTITTVAGTGAQGYADGPAGGAQLQFPFGMAMSPSGLLYFADMTCQCWNPAAPGRVRLLNLATGTIRTVMTGQTPVSG